MGKFELGVCENVLLYGHVAWQKGSHKMHLVAVAIFASSFLIFQKEEYKYNKMY